MNEIARQMIASVCREVADLDQTDEIDGISVVIVMADGHLRTLAAYREGAKLPLLAGMAIASQDFIASNCRPAHDDREDNQGGDMRGRGA